MPCFCFSIYFSTGPQIWPQSLYLVLVGNLETSPLIKVGPSSRVWRPVHPFCSVVPWLCQIGLKTQPSAADTAALNTKGHGFPSPTLLLYPHFLVLKVGFYRTNAIHTRSYKIDRVRSSCRAKHVPVALWPMELCRRPISLDSPPAVNIWKTNKTTLHSDKPSTEINKARCACQKVLAVSSKWGFLNISTLMSSPQNSPGTSLLGSQPHLLRPQQHGLLVFVSLVRREHVFICL